jgi:hypothetical protein
MADEQGQAEVAEALLRAQMEALGLEEPDAVVLAQQQELVEGLVEAGAAPALLLGARLSDRALVMEAERHSVEVHALRWDVEEGRAQEAARAQALASTSPGLTGWGLFWGELALVALMGVALVGSLFLLEWSMWEALVSITMEEAFGSRPEESFAEARFLSVVVLLGLMGPLTLALMVTRGELPWWAKLGHLVLVEGLFVVAFLALRAPDGEFHGAALPVALMELSLVLGHGVASWALGNWMGAGSRQRRVWEEARRLWALAEAARKAQEARLEEAQRRAEAAWGRLAAREGEGHRVSALARVGRSHAALIHFEGAMKNAANADRERDAEALQTLLGGRA